MKKQLLTATIALLSTVNIFARDTIIMGDVVRKNESMVFNKNIICTAYSMPTDGKEKELTYGEYTLAAVQNNHIHLSGQLDGELFSVSGNLDNETLNISLQGDADPATAGKPTYYFSSMGSLAKEQGAVTLTVLMNGRSKAISCGKKSN